LKNGQLGEMSAKVPKM